MTKELELQIFLEQVCEEYESQARGKSLFVPLGEFLEEKFVGSPSTVVDISWKRAAAAELIKLREQLAVAAGLAWQHDQVLAELPPELHPEPRSTAKESVTASGVSFISDHESKQQIVQSGMTLGAYTLVKQLGSGGMGTVWQADQFSPVRRQVAIKFVKVGHQHSRMRARFEAERQALAIMDHPNIAKVFDGGQTSDGSPYLVMELVDGTPLAHYCDEHRLNLTQRLKLLVAVCRAVQHAHLKGIIHRDLKPSNVLVSIVDGEPTPKVIDFGLAKALDQGMRLADQSTYTEIGQIVGSYQYMSPEQASLSGTDIDARTDVYSLGVILYELLTGTTPVTRGELRETPLVDLLQTIRTRDVAKPSNRLANIAPSEQSSIANCRNTEPSSLQTSLRSELDWIALKSLEPVRENRYDTANELANDIQRYLDGEVVSARPPSLRYRLQKSLQRNRALVLAASSVLVVLLIGVISTLWMLVEARRARNDADERAEKLLLSQTETETALRSSLISEAGFLAKQRDTLGWSWQVADKLKKASDLKPTEQQMVDLRSLWLDTSLGLDAKHIQSLPSGKYWFRIRFSPDGRFLVAAELKDNVEVSIYVYDTRTWELHKRIGIKDNPIEFIGRIWEGKKSQEGIESIEFSGDGRWLAVGTRQGRIHLWDVREDFKKFVQWDSPGRIRVHSLYFSHSGKLLLWRSITPDEKLTLHARRWTEDHWQEIDHEFPSPNLDVTTYTPGKISCGKLGGQRYWFTDPELDPCEPSEYLDAHFPLNSSSLYGLCPKGKLSLIDHITGGRQSLAIQNSDSDFYKWTVFANANADLCIYAVAAGSPIVSLMQSCNGKTESMEWPVVGRLSPAIAMSPTDANLMVTATDNSIEVYQTQGKPDYVSRFELIGCYDLIDMRVTQDTIWTVSVQTTNTKAYYQIGCYERRSSKLIQCTNIVPASKTSDFAVRFTKYGSVSLLLGNCGWFEFDRDKPAVLKHNPISKQPTQTTELRYGVPVTTILLDQSYLPEALSTAMTLHPLPVEEEASPASKFFSVHHYPAKLSGKVVKVHDAQTLEPLGIWENKTEDILTGKAIFAQSDVLGDSLVVSGEDGFVRQFDIEANIIGRLEATQVMMRSIDCRSGKFLASGMDGTVIYGSNLKKREVISWIPEKDDITTVGLLEDDLCIIGTRHSGASLWKLSETPELILRIPTAGLSVKRICTDPSGQSFAIIYDRTNVVHVWSIPRMREAIAGRGLGW